MCSLLSEHQQFTLIGMFVLGNTIERTTIPPREFHETHTLLHKALLEVIERAASQKCRPNHTTSNTLEFYTGL